MNRKYLVVLIVVVIGIVVAVSVVNKSPKNGNALRIGDISTLTGNAAYYGQSTMKGTEIGKLQAVKDHPNLAIELYHEDSMFTPKGGIDAYTKLRQTKDINAVITMASPVSMAVEPLAIKDNIIVGAVSTLANKFSTPNDATFRLTSMVSYEVVPLLKYLRETGVKKLGVLYMNNDTGVGLKDSLVNGVAGYGISIVANEGFANDTIDFKTLLLKVKQSGAEAVYLASLANLSAKILTQAHDLGITAKFVSYRGAEDPLLVKGTGNLADGIIYTSGYDITSTSEQNTKFVSSYRERYNEDPNEYAAEAYESVRMIADIYANCANDVPCVSKYISSTKNRPSIFESLSFDENGDVIHNFILKTVKDGKFVKLQQ